MSSKVPKPCVLIISDSPDRRNFLRYHITCQNLKPLWYPNILSARKAIREDPFSMVVVDLSLPVEPKLTLMKEVSYYQPDAQIITIGKVKHLKGMGTLPSLSSIESIDSIETFPDRLGDYITGISGKKSKGR